MRKLTKKQTLCIAIPLIVIMGCFAILGVIWGISRGDLEAKRKIAMVGEWEEQNWSPSDTFNIDDYPSFTLDVGQAFHALTLTDVHYTNDGWYGDYLWVGGAMNTKTDKNIDKLIKEADPNLIIVTGDLVTGALNDLLYERFANFIDAYDIPWTVTFGNHDGERRADKPYLMNIMQKTKNNIFMQGPTNLGTDAEPLAGGLGNYIINLKSPLGDVFHSMIMVDTGDWQNMEQNQKANKRGEHAFSRVSVGLTDRQIEWYEWVLRGLEGHNKSVNTSNKMPETTMYYHIGMKAYNYGAILGDYSKATEYPVNDLPFATDAEWARPADNTKEVRYDELIKLYFNKVNVKPYHKLTDGILNDMDKNLPYALVREELKTGYNTHIANDLFFRKVKELGSTKTFVSGHNHCDGYSVVYDGITYIAVVKTSDIYVDTDWDNGNRGATRITYKNTPEGVKITSTPLYHRFDNVPSKNYPRPIA